MGNARLDDRALLDHAAAELFGITGSRAYGDRELAFAMLAALGVDLDHANVGPQDRTPLRDAPTKHLMRRARILADDYPRDERSDYPKTKAVW